MTTATTRTNSYAGTCHDCGTHVAAQAGLLGAKIDGRWTIRHTACPTTTASTPRPASRTYASTCDAGHRNPVAGCFCCANGIGR